MAAIANKMNWETADDVTAQVQVRSGVMKLRVVGAPTFPKGSKAGNFAGPYDLADSADLTMMVNEIAALGHHPDKREIILIKVRQSDEDMLHKPTVKRTARSQQMPVCIWLSKLDTAYNLLSETWQESQGYRAPKKGAA